jgi:hypothetical protein
MKNLRSGIYWHIVPIGQKYLVRRKSICIVFALRRGEIYGKYTAFPFFFYICYDNQTNILIIDKHLDEISLLGKVRMYVRTVYLDF